MIETFLIVLSTGGRTHADPVRREDPYCTVRVSYRIF